MHPNCAAVNEILQAAGVTGRVRLLDEVVATARAAAEQLGCPVGAIANSLIFETSKKAAADAAPLLIMTSGAHRVDMNKVGEQLGYQLRRASPALYASTPTSRSEASLQSVTRSPSLQSSTGHSPSSTSCGLPAASRTPSFH
jgi:hypothetical protein